MYGNKQSLAYLEALYKSLAIDYFCYGCLSSDFCKKKRTRERIPARPIHAKTTANVTPKATIISATVKTDIEETTAR